MKFYLAGRQSFINRIGGLRDTLEQNGHTTTLDWTKEPSYQPYEANKVAAADFASRTILAVKSADFFVLFWDESLYGALIELGMFLASRETTGKVFIVGDKNRVCLFETLPNVVVLSDEREIIDRL